jgi:hypothetical protein
LLKYPHAFGQHIKGGGFDYRRLFILWKIADCQSSGCGIALAVLSGYEARICPTWRHGFGVTGRRRSIT